MAPGAHRLATRALLGGCLTATRLRELKPEGELPSRCLRKLHTFRNLVELGLVELVLSAHHHLEPPFAVANDAIHLLVLRPGDIGQADLDRLIESLSLRAQPIYPPGSLLQRARVPI